MIFQWRGLQYCQRKTLKYEGGKQLAGMEILKNADTKEVSKFLIAPVQGLLSTWKLAFLFSL